MASTYETNYLRLYNSKRTEMTNRIATQLIYLTLTAKQNKVRTNMRAPRGWWRQRGHLSRRQNNVGRPVTRSKRANTRQEPPKGSSVQTPEQCETISDKERTQTGVHKADAAKGVVCSDARTMRDDQWQGTNENRRTRDRRREQDRANKAA